MKKIFALLLSAVTAVGMITTASAWEENTDYVVLGQSNSQAYSVTNASYPECTTGQLLTGTVAQCLKSSTENSADKMFDGDTSTYYENTSNSFAYLILDQAYELTEIRCAPTTAEGVKLDTHFGLVIQGSNDGENWVTIIHRAHDAFNYDYRIYAPSFAIEQAYMDAGYGKTPFNDGSIWWRGKGGSYSIYRVLNATVGEIEFYGNPAEATDTSTPEKTSALDYATPYYFPGNIHVMENAEVVTVDGSLTGTVIGAGGAWNGANYDLCFNDNNRRSYDPPLEGPQCWVGLKMDQPYALTEVRVLPKRDSLGRSNMLGAQVQGSVDGVNWRTLAVFSAEDIPDKQEYVIKTVTDTDGYTYFRYVNCYARQSSCCNLLLFGAPAEAAEPFTCEPLIATHNTFEGTIVSAAEKNVVTGTEISGTPICGQYYYGWTDRKQGMEAAFDGDIKTEYCTISSWLGPQYWAGLKPDAPTVCKTVRIYRDKIEDTYYFQGSVDGVTWVDLTTFNTKVDTKDAEGWLTKTVDDATEYSYFRLFNSNIDNFDTGMAVSEIKIYSEEYVAPETTAPETAAPETAAPETDAPETTAPETDAPETAAPETDAPETAAPETAAPETAAPETAAPETEVPATEAPETEAPATEAPATEAPAESTPVIAIIGIAAAAVVVLGILVAVFKKKK